MLLHISCAYNRSCNRHPHLHTRYRGVESIMKKQNWTAIRHICRSCLRNYRHRLGGRIFKAQYRGPGKSRLPDFIYHYGRYRTCDKCLAWQRVLNQSRKPKREGAFVQWANEYAMQAIYLEAKRRTIDTHCKHEVDHMIPLNGTGVCGLHVETNLRIVEKRRNSHKSNTFNEQLLLRAITEAQQDDILQGILRRYQQPVEDILIRRLQTDRCVTSRDKHKPSHKAAAVSKAAKSKRYKPTARGITAPTDIQRQHEIKMRRLHQRRELRHLVRAVLDD